MGVFLLIIIMPGLNACGLQSKLLKERKKFFLNEQKVGMLLQKVQIPEE